LNFDQPSRLTKEDTMSDPRYTDPRYSDPRRPGMNPDAPHRLDLDAPDRASSTWTWLAAIVAILVVLGLAISYNRTEEASTRPNTPTTTGAAPSAPRPAAPTNPASNDLQPKPATPAPPTPSPN
jgi:hypothetical protein